MRKFYLECDGTRYGLNGENGVFCDTPTGLGIVYTSTATRIVDGFYAATERYQNVGQFVCNINFVGSTQYATYQTISDAIFCADELRLIYNPNGTEYTADAVLVSLTKTEIAQNGVLTCPLTLQMTSLWYTEQTQTGTGSVSVTTGGQIAPAIVLTTTGTALTNPVITITETVGSAEVARCAITGTVAAADTLQYSNLYDDAHLYQTISGAVTDIIEKVNTAYTVFGRTKKNFRVSCSNASAALSVRVRRYWRSV